MSAEDARKFVEQVKKRLGDGIVGCSSVEHGLADLLEAEIGEGKRVPTILEIGTWRGVSAVVLARFAYNVITIDVKAQPEVMSVLEAGACTDRVAPIIVPNNEAKAILVKQLDFDLAFVDGGHSFAQVQYDLAITRRCGHVLFHDYPDSGSGIHGVGDVLDSLPPGEIEPCPPFCWWRARP